MGALALGALGLSACAVPTHDASPFPGARRDLAARAVTGISAPTTASRPAAASRLVSSSPAAPGEASSGGAAPGAGASPGATGSSAPATAGPLTIATLTDPPGDAGPAAPAYADIVGVRLESLGADVRVTVELAGRLPAHLAGDEVMGVGVDLYRPGATESDDSLFADGEPDGWYGYLQTPSGLVRYPGTLAVGGSAVVFEVPWSSVGDLRDGGVSAFVDWSRSQPLKVASSDRAPDTGAAAWAR